VGRMDLRGGFVDLKLAGAGWAGTADEISSRSRAFVLLARREAAARCRSWRSVVVPSQTRCVVELGIRGETDARAPRVPGLRPTGPAIGLRSTRATQPTRANRPSVGDVAVDHRAPVRVQALLQSVRRRGADS